MPTMFKRYFTEAEEKQLFVTVKGRSGLLAQRDSAWMRLLRATGMRVGALSQLTVGHARAALRTGHIDLQSEIQKKGVEHQVFVSKACTKALHDLLRVRREMGCPERLDDPLIISRNYKSAQKTDSITFTSGECSANFKGLSIRSYQSRLTHWCKQAELGFTASPHWFRHTVGKRIMKNSTAQDPRGVAQEVLGHISGRSTEIYTRPDREDIEQAMREVC